MESVTIRLNDMNIELEEDIREPIALMCYHKTTT